MTAVDWALKANSNINLSKYWRMNFHGLFDACLACRPDMIFAVDWALIINHLSILPRLLLFFPRNDEYSRLLKELGDVSRCGLTDMQTRHVDSAMTLKR